MPDRRPPSSDRSVWVFRLPVNGLTVSFTNSFRMPIGADLIHCALQRDSVALWFEVEPDAEKEARSFQLIGTGQTVRPGLQHVGTVIVGPQQDLVLHVYEVLS